MSLESSAIHSEKTLHICRLDKFIPPFIDLIKENFAFSKHDFLLFGNLKTFPTILDKNVIHFKHFYQIFELIVKMNSSKKIVLHSLFNPLIVLLLFLQPWLLKKCYWIMWGGDLYCFQNKRNSIKAHTYEKVRAFIIKNMGFLVSGTTGDYELAKAWYGAKGAHIRCFNYPSNIYKHYDLSSNAHSTINIQVGNSADPSNRHLLTLEALIPFKQDNIKLFSPLSYGDMEYANVVINKGYELFGNQFQPLQDLLPFEDYLAFLANIDIAIFNHNRQQALGNAVTLLGLGKKVYINPDSTLNGLFKEFDLQVFDVSQFNIHPIDRTIANQNMQNVKKHFSKEGLLKSLGSWIE
ncbi:TDP-N-acetylfucosamine:lipid II N-acetylfucosaminyltransferase [Methylophilus sp. OH31]|uniref:TDP-N-acetylfucosamine:lipid II N-acetylfucosaminyltransferase n=1 Tax=Methylophilus sp. OH31 TaxID=1387312 RepID=UPI000465DF0A|nr:TDP-N-acetylfucosamine:lipid II N-acetylfucosaminyltransferase [Methylophilus sp. OH31]